MEILDAKTTLISNDKLDMEKIDDDMFVFHTVAFGDVEVTVNGTSFVCQSVGLELINDFWYLVLKYTNLIDDAECNISIFLNHIKTLKVQ